MATHKSAEKRARQALVRRDRNRAVKSRVRTFVKAVRESAAQGDSPDLQERLRSAERELRKAASSGVLPKRRVSRLVSRLAKQANRARQG